MSDFKKNAIICFLAGWVVADIILALVDLL